MDIYKYPSVTGTLNSSQPDRVEVHFTDIDLSNFLPLDGSNSLWCIINMQKPRMHQKNTECLTRANGAFLQRLFGNFVAHRASKLAIMP